MIISSAQKSDIGRNPKRSQNEDYIWLDEQAKLFIVADGMGGQESGEVASQMAATMVGEWVRTQLESKETLSDSDVPALLLEALETANAKVYQAGAQAQQKRKMGATLVMAVLVGEQAYISNAGDARAYLLRGATIMQLTRDHSWSAELEAGGIITREQAENHPFGNVVTKAIGQEPPLEPAFYEVSLAVDDWLLLCSDGLWNMVPDEQLMKIVQNSQGNPSQAVTDLVKAANEAGGKDNISIVLVRVLAGEA